MGRDQGLEPNALELPLGHALRSCTLRVYPNTNTIPNSNASQTYSQITMT
jgi:hypothetical protein